MKHDLEQRLRSQARRELREAPPGLASRVLQRLDEPAPQAAPAPARARPLVPLALAAGLAALAFVAWQLWPRPLTDDMAAGTPPPRPGAPEMVVGLAQTGIELAARVDEPLKLEWHNLVRDSRELCASVLEQLPSLPRAQ